MRQRPRQEWTISDAEIRRETQTEPEIEAETGGKNGEIGRER